MASVVKIKRSSVQGKAPTTSDIQTGELALNTRDGKLFSTDGSSVFEVGANLSSLSVSSNNGIKFYESDGTSYVQLTGPSSLTTNITLTLPNSDGTADQILRTDGAGNLSWVDPTTADSGGFTRGTLATFPDGDYLEGGSGTETYVGELADENQDAFGVSLGAVYDCMDPTGRYITEDLGVLS
jgi:hypothetical protein